MKKMAKRGDVSQVFVYITAVIIFGVVFLFGYRAINHLLEESDKVGFITFKTDIESAVRSIKTDFDSATVYAAEKPLRVPPAYTLVCFVDFVGLSPAACDTWKTYPSWEETTANVFVTPEGPASIKVSPIKLRDAQGQPVDHLCIPTRGRLDMRLVGRGSHTLISPLPS